MAAIDQGTSSTRCVIVDHAGAIVSSAQREHRQHFPRAGWVEHDPLEIWDCTVDVVQAALRSAGLVPADLAACGITNQRETAVAWDRESGRPIHPAIVWQDARTDERCRRLGALGGGTDRYRDRTGLPLATYFTGPKWSWILDHVEGGRERARRGEVLLGTVDSWLLWNLTGGPQGGLHLTDVTNASRTLLMDLEELAWAPDIAADLGIPLEALPEIRSSSEVYAVGHRDGPLPGVPLAAALGDQQAAMVGHGCFTPGSAKNTYGTGSFLLTHTGTKPVRSEHGLVSTLCYQLGSEPACYALEGSIAVTGSLVHWLRDNLGLIGSADDVEPLAASVPDTGGVYFVPAFSGLFAPRWRPDARGVIVGLTRFTTRGHIARAALEATCFQTREVVEAMEADTGQALKELRVDGGMTVNSLVMQLQSDVLGIPVVRASAPETTALGAAFAAGLAVGYWSDPDEVTTVIGSAARWSPQQEAATREAAWRDWHKAVDRSLGWVSTDSTDDSEENRS
jgi:glycerol kinase